METKIVTEQTYKTYVEKEIERAPKAYRDIHAKHPDAVILFRTGDFYEAYCDDAQACHDVLGVTITNHKYRIAGFPYHALDIYLPKLIRAGKRVAIYEKD
jgi:DNA mismatch repair protein MutS